MAMFFKKNSVIGDLLSIIMNRGEVVPSVEEKKEAKNEEKRFFGKSLFRSVKEYNHQMEEVKKNKKEKEENKKTEEKTGETGENGEIKEIEEFKVEIEEKVEGDLLADKNNNEFKDDNVINLEDKLNIKSNESNGIKNILELLEGTMEITKQLEKKTVEIGEEYGGKEHMVGA